MYAMAKANNVKLAYLRIAIFNTLTLEVTGANPRSGICVRLTE